MLLVTVSDNLAVSVQSSVLVHRSHTTTLPCWLNPPQNAEDLEVRWYREDKFDTPIILYRAQMSDASQEASYKGRVSFGLKDTTSGGLKAGDVSLKLVNVTVEDAGDYTCYISSDQGYDKGSVWLSVTGECHESGKKIHKTKGCSKKSCLHLKMFLIFLLQPP